MERSLSAVVFFTVLAALVPVASAQATDPAQPPGCEHRGHGGPGPGARVDFMIHMLGLDAQQAATVRQIVADAGPERERIRAMPRGSAEQIAARHALEAQTHARIDAVLDDTQRAQLARMREWRDAHGGEGVRGRGGRRGHPGGTPTAPPAGI